MVIAPRTVILAFVIGIVVTVLAAFVPSLRATISPILAVRGGRASARSLCPVHSYVALLILVVALLLLARGAFTDELGIRPRLLSLPSASFCSSSVWR